MTTPGITAEDVVRLFERDAGARRRLAELLVSEPEVRLAIINAVLRDVATRQDLREAVRELRDYTDKRFAELKDYVDRRLAELRGYVDTRFTELREYVDKRLAELKEYVDARFDRLESELRELRNRLWWVVATVILGWLAVMLEQYLLLVLKHA